MELSNFVIFLFFILNLFDLTFCVEPKTNGGSSNTRPNSLTIFQEKEVDVPPGFAPRPRISPPQNNQSHVTTREYSDRLQQFIRPVILTPRQNFQSSDKNIRTLYDGKLKYFGPHYIISSFHLIP
ncbi:unnamed protein product [Meloidogyne enterolobii]|uniref:Uncharacterized protein n=1 Tax=Meloidogyne enterolobii TaxID=390850 RepID=A0ACB1B3D0_MELEN